MKVGIFYHIARVNPDDVKRAHGLLISRGASVEFFSSAEEIQGVDRLVVFGGDGSILHAAKKAAVLEIPIVAVNYGTIGFLAEFERGQIEGLVDLVLDENALISRRPGLEITFRGKKYFCLNELAIMREVSPVRPSGTSHIFVSINGHDAGEFTADGLIVSTPTGSTAYSLAAGGSILTPDSESFILTPVCSFSLRGRPIVCSDKSEFSFRFPEGSALILHGDGIYIGETNENDVVIVKKAERNALFLTKDKTDFFRRLTEKIY